MTVIIIVVVAGILLLLFMWKQANENNIRKHVIHAEGIEEKVRLFFISDTHARKINEKMIASITEPINAVVIGGDFVDRRTSERTIDENIQLLKKLGPVYFVWGNNDKEIGEKKLRQLFQQHQITIIENDSIELASENKLALSGVIYSPSEQNIKEALNQCKEASTVFVAHNPEQFPVVYRHFKPLLSLAGHLHGGQIRLGQYGIQPHGYFNQVDGLYKLVSNGYGTTLLPIRLGAKPECHIIEINFKQN
ncbi:metallophosphoesterase [Solibacillus sp. FSL R7-0682]|uniref:metallophosphoesterase n=1 Tax=Solibacillus sp. FSL R7-0682 TaxID=2921690 RepID=UPI0030FA7C63